MVKKEDKMEKTEYVAGIVMATELNVRSSPDTTKEPIDVLKQGQLVKIESRVDDWYKIEYDNYITINDKKILLPSTSCGYVSAKYLKGLTWEQKIVKEAFDLGLITSDEWIDKYNEKTTVWFTCAVAINILKKLQE